MICLELLMAVAMTTFGVFVASRISKMESFQVVMQMLLLPMLFLSGALFPLNGLPSWLAFITRLNPLTYAIAPVPPGDLRGATHVDHCSGALLHQCHVVRLALALWLELRSW